MAHTNSPRKHGREVIQKGKNGKRRKEWHHGAVESAKWDRVVVDIDRAFKAAGIK